MSDIFTTNDPQAQLLKISAKQTYPGTITIHIDTIVEESEHFQSIIRAARADAVRSLADEDELALRDGVGSARFVAEWLNAEAGRIEAATDG